MACEIVLVMGAVGWTMVVMVVEKEEEEGEMLTAVFMTTVCCVGTRNAKDKITTATTSQ